jgi:hypothetical protein
MRAYRTTPAIFSVSLALCTGLLAACESATEPQAVRDAGSVEGDAAARPSDAGGGADAAPTCGPRGDEQQSYWLDSEERCNGWDDDCDGLVDEHGDLDEDGHSICALTNDLALDCDDHEPRAWSGREELCDGVDNDCDGSWDEGLAGPCPTPVCTSEWDCPGKLTCIEPRQPCVVPGTCPEVLLSEKTCDAPATEWWRPLPCDPGQCRHWQDGTCWGDCECAADGLYRWRNACTE